MNLEHEDMSFSPFKVRKFSKENVEKLFGPKADGALANKTRLENSELYFAVREQAVEDGLVGPASYATPTELQAHSQKLAAKAQGEQVTQEEFESRAKHPYQKVKDFFSGRLTELPPPAVLRVKNPELYRELHVAARSYKILANEAPVEVSSNVKPSSVPKFTPEPRHGIPAEYAQVFGLPENYQATSSEFNSMVKAMIEYRAEQAAAQTPPANDKPADSGNNGDIQGGGQ